MKTSEVLKRDKLYPLRESPIMPQNLRARWTGEKRCPRKGEWYLSGAIIGAYKARADLTTKFHIAEIVEVTTTEIVRVIGTTG